MPILLYGCRGVAPRVRNQILVGAAQEQLARIPDGSVQCCVTSPPYYGLRDYGMAGQLGQEATLQQYVQSLVNVFREVRRVLRDDGLLWLNLGDSYAQEKGHGHWTSQQAKGDENGQRVRKFWAARGAEDFGLKPKDMMGVPWRVAFALQDDGWYLRSDVIWSKPNCMPESVSDRPTKSHEYVFLLSKSRYYFYDQDAIREPHTMTPQRRLSRVEDRETFGQRQPHTEAGYRLRPEVGIDGHSNGRNKRTVWNINPKPYKGAHFAVMPEELASICIKAGTSERGCCSKCGAPWRRRFNPETKAQAGWAPGCTCEAGIEPCLVLDPFSGAGTTAVTAARLGRAYLGVELNPSYVELALKRLAPVLDVRAQQEVVAEFWHE